MQKRDNESYERYSQNRTSVKETMMKEKRAADRRWRLGDAFSGNWKMCRLRLKREK